MGIETIKICDRIMTLKEVNEKVREIMWNIPRFEKIRIDIERKEDGIHASIYIRR